MHDCQQRYTDDDYNNFSFEFDDLIIPESSSPKQKHDDEKEDKDNNEDKDKNEGINLIQSLAQTQKTKLMQKQAKDKKEESTHHLLSKKGNISKPFEEVKTTTKLFEVVKTTTKPSDIVKITTNTNIDNNITTKLFGNNERLFTLRKSKPNNRNVATEFPKSIEETEKTKETEVIEEIEETQDTEEEFTSEAKKLKEEEEEAGDYDQKNYDDDSDELDVFISDSETSSSLPI